MVTCHSSDADPPGSCTASLQAPVPDISAPHRDVSCHDGLEVCNRSKNLLIIMIVLNSKLPSLLISIQRIWVKFLGTFGTGSARKSASSVDPPTRSTRSPCRALADGGPWYRLTKALRRGTPGSSESAWEKILGKPPLNSSNREMWKFTNCWKRMVNLRGKKTEKCVCIYIRITWIFHSYIILLFRV